jgi:hypothetical protein
MNASSIESGSTSGLTSSNSRRTCAPMRRYFAMSPWTKTASGQSLRACTDGIAERTPKTRASYEHAATTPRCEEPPTMTGRPRSSG